MYLKMPWPRCRITDELRPQSCTPKPQEKCTWEAPREGIYEVNFDANFCIQKKVGGTDVFIRDYNVLVIVAMHMQSEHIPNAKIAKAEIAYQAPEFALNLGLQHIILKGDALNIINVIKGNKQDLSMIENIIEEVKKNYNVSQTCHIKRFRRIPNNTAHTLAKQTFLNKEIIVWMKDNPQHH